MYIAQVYCWQAKPSRPTGLNIYNTPSGCVGILCLHMCEFYVKGSKVILIIHVHMYHRESSLVFLHRYWHTLSLTESEVGEARLAIYAL